MPKSPTARRPRTVAALLDGALRAFAERGFDGASIGYICQRAGLTTGAFYSNFGDKQELFIALFEAHAERIVARLEELTSEVEAHPERLDTLLREAPGNSAEERLWSLVSLEFDLFAARHPEQAGELIAHELRLREHIAALLGRALHAAGRASWLQPAELARTLLALHAGFALQRGGDPVADWSHTLERRVLPHLLRALSTSEG